MLKLLLTKKLDGIWCSCVSISKSDKSLNSFFLTLKACLMCIDDIYVVLMLLLLASKTAETVFIFMIKQWPSFHRVSIIHSIAINR